ncbi:hypothetical protein HGP28_10645 [Vibrio sp. SM6]|uniref:Uncharacterized protein n=1 Tax=Vibrio agarilyticus TaxID=2726741 RepID=A0A7X8TRB7_9VIBR|nr:hypothetical protein [Vibrio agarilyticus]NLS13350.1 hypothetical protein [Vibrio agarilyticus]
MKICSKKDYRALEVELDYLCKRTSVISVYSIIDELHDDTPQAFRLALLIGRNLRDKRDLKGGCMAPRQVCSHELESRLKAHYTNRIRKQDEAPEMGADSSFNRLFPRGV